jgi:hypothetical protein
MKKLFFFILLMSMSCRASDLHMPNWVLERILRLLYERVRVQKEYQRPTEELMNSSDSRDDVIRMTQETSKFLALDRRLIIDRRKELVKSQVVPLEKLEFLPSERIKEAIRDQKKQMRREDLKNRMREVRLHMAEKRRKKK